METPLMMKSVCVSFLLFDYFKDVFLSCLQGANQGTSQFHISYSSDSGIY